LGKDFNPFLPYEENLFVTDISDTHVCLLNKFNVVEDHLLIITRAFEEQESLLNLQDFFALWTCMAEFDGLAFYNSGKIAGASQRHKHLQIVPLPLTNTGVNIPLDRLLSQAVFDDPIGVIPALPYQHGLFKLDPMDDRSPLAAAPLILDGYNRLLQRLKLVKNGEDYPQPYNLLVTRQWMLIVPRSAEFFESIAINSLGFAGALLVKNEEQLQFLQAYGIMNVLKNVAFPMSSD
jgi:ATP adenylyltransferase